MEKDFWKNRFLRRRILSFGSPICCPSVTYVLGNLPQEIFRVGYRSNVDWQAWEMISRMNGSFVYCNKDCPRNQVNTYYTSSNTETNEIVPPDDLVIDDYKKLTISLVNSSYLYKLQKKYIRKVDMVSQCTFAFLVMYDKYTLGGFGFTLPQHKGFDLFQLTDFCTNNAIPRLSKLILYCIQTTLVQKALSRKMHKLCERVISLAYTHKPVSMKYRGVYNKMSELSTSSYLAYEGILGKYQSTKEVVEKYIKSLKNGK